MGRVEATSIEEKAMPVDILDRPEAVARAKGRRSLPERRQAFLDAARDVFLEKGYASATIDEVVARAGGSKATVYSLFENKEGLFAALVAEAAEELADLLQRSQPTGRIEDNLRTFGRRY